MVFSDSPRPAAIEAIRFLNTTPYWLDDASRPSACPALSRDIAVDLLVVGAGFSGLWAALLAKQDDPTASVAVVDAGRIADGATGRNGGFISHSLTHGALNAVARWPHEARQLSRLGHENFQALVGTIRHLGIDCGLHIDGEITVAVQQHQVGELRHLAQVARSIGDRVDDLSSEQVQAMAHSSSYLGAVIDRDIALVNPARLAWGLAEAARGIGVEIFEHTRVLSLHDADARVVAVTAGGSITARRVALATNAYPSVVPSITRYVVPVYDYVLVTEPLTDAQWRSVGWDGGQGFGDAGNQFHYYRRTDDGRILWGGYDAIYHRDVPLERAMVADRESFGRLAEHFLQTFPQLLGVRFTHGWGGAIDTCSRFSPFWGLEHGGKTAYVAGYTGLGVGASRFGAQVMLDLLSGRVTERTSLEMVRTKPVAFPPEPLRSLGIAWTTRALQAADRHAGRRSLWLRALDRAGLGFAS